MCSSDLISRWVKPQEFSELSALAQKMGFAAVMSGPMVRSSYRAGMLWGRAMVERGWPIPAHLASLAERREKTEGGGGAKPGAAPTGGTGVPDAVRSDAGYAGMRSGAEAGC